ncbi:hypothetical protein PC9H_009231 [Pleurotus ostreatus]|uniref:Uncharacterized protein n=1 Tax=Pleurotus ostreatus TaxID=5322 RepID=A0A8H6ZLE6_PLEOS|nr:uncharacterized protein PC9H_009231 [Pleurotus ostreatus]KAF7423933.1 hypothetical protein PC9H_009231 [Pleurotus ostreatus]
MYTMALVCRDPALAEKQMAFMSREAYDKLMRLRAESGCSSNGHVGDKCVFFVDSCSFAHVRAWGQPAFRDIRPPSRPYPYPHGDAPPPPPPTTKRSSSCAIRAAGASPSPSSSRAGRTSSPRSSTASRTAPSLTPVSTRSC